jgi:Spy/CpxP family protein refolding chaperone
MIYNYRDFNRCAALGVRKFKSDKQEEVMKKILFAVLLTVVFAMPAFSQMPDVPMKGHGEGHGEGHGQMMERDMDMMGGDMMCMGHGNKMGLTDDQMMKMKPLLRDMQIKQIRFKADLKIAEIELREIMEVKDFDLDKASSAVKKIENLKTAQHLEMLKAMKDMRTILTGDQFKKMHKMCMKSGDKQHGMMMHKPHTKKPGIKKPADDMKDMKH